MPISDELHMYNLLTFHLGRGINKTANNLKILKYRQQDSLNKLPDGYFV